MPAPVDDEPEVELDGWEDEADRRYDDSREERTHGPESAVDDELPEPGPAIAPEGKTVTQTHTGSGNNVINTSLFD